MSDSTNWNIWLPVIASVSSAAALCSVGLVVYCYCRIRDNLTPVGYSEGHDLTREPEPIRNGPSADRHHYPGAFNDYVDGLDSEPTNRPVSNSVVERNNPNRVKFRADEDDFVDNGASIRMNQRRTSSRGELALRVAHESPPGRNYGLTNEPEAPTYHHDNHIVEHDDGTQDVFV